MNDLEFLRRFEPIINYTQGEMFFPCAVDGYLERCGLWSRDAAGNEAMIVEPGNLVIEALACTPCASKCFMVSPVMIGPIAGMILS